MNWSSEPLARGRVLRDTPVGGATRADLGMVSARPARTLVVSQDLVDAATRDGYVAGHAQGFSEGYEDGIAEAGRHVEQLAGLVGRLGAAAESLTVRETTARADIEDQVVATAFRIAEVIVGHAVSRPDDRGRDAIARALQLAPDQGLVTARLNPADAAVLAQHTNVAPGRALEIVADASIAPGDCVVDVGACRVDARIGTALDRVREVLGLSGGVA